MFKLTKANNRIKKLYKNKCKIHNDKCLIIHKLNKHSIINNNQVHILDASDIRMSHLLNNLPSNMDYLEIFLLSYDLINLPIKLKKLYVISCKNIAIKVPHDCIFINKIIKDITEDTNATSIIIGNEKYSDYTPMWLEMWHEVGDTREKDIYSHTGKTLDYNVREIYELADY